jgi:prepilin-type N-terminal cleavage/methylation domain-containing protein
MDDTRRDDTAGRRKMGRLSASRRGFTLLELLISLTLLVVIVVITMGAMRLGSRSVAAGEKKMNDRERFRTVLSLMDAQIQSQIPLTYEEAVSGKKYYFRGDGKTLRFCTSYSIWSGRRGYVIVDYRVETGDSGREILFASERTPGIEDQGRSTSLMEADGIALDYFYKDPTEERGKWVELLPARVIPEKIRLRLTGQEKLTLVFPVRVQYGMAPLPGAGNP